MIKNRPLFNYLDKIDGESWLNLGSGNDKAARYLIDDGRSVTDVDIIKTHNFTHERYTFMEWDLEAGIPFEIEENSLTYDVVLASHILEHMQDTGLFLSYCKDMLNYDGILIVVVPPYKPGIVGGHVHLWNMGLLMYNLVLSGFDVVDGHFKKEGYNIMAIVRNWDRISFDLKHDTGDIEILVKDGFLPSYFHQGMGGDLEIYNWFE